MKITAPDYYLNFKCTADSCRHTCCAGWEVDIDEKSLERFRPVPEIFREIDLYDTPHFRLKEGDRCPFLQENGLCRMIIEKGEDFLCNICRDHPRFRNFFTGETELGLGLVCEEAARIILSSAHPLALITLSDDGENTALPPDEQYIKDLRARLISEITEEGPPARLLEYLIYRHLPDALYDGLLQERIDFIYNSYDEIISTWQDTGRSLAELIEICRRFSYDIEYDDEELNRRLLYYSSTDL